MPFDLAQIKAANPIAEVIGRDVALQKAGREFKGLCPIHGEKTPSFTVMPDRGRFHCFGCGVDGDVLDYIQISRKCDLPAACEMLGGGDDHPMQPRPAPPAPAPGTIWTPVMPVPDDVPPPPTRHIRFGAPEHVSRVLNQAGELMHLIYRWPPPSPGEHKVIRPVTFDGAGWVWKWPPKPRPLYGLPLTAGMPVLLVEGEKKRDAAAAALEGFYDVVSWPAGAQGVAHAGWQTLRGLDVVMWPDADPAGVAAAQAVSGELAGVASRFRLLNPPPAVEQGWDVADAIEEGWSVEQLLQFINTAKHVRDPNSEPPEPDPYDPGPEPIPEELEQKYAPSRRARRQADGGVEWGDPLDFLGDDELGAPDLRSEHIPDALWPFVADTATRMGVDPTGVALGALVACASVIDDEWKLQPRRFDYTWTESARLWAAILGGPSTIKTPLIAACTKPIEKLDIEARKRHADDMRAYKSAMAEYKRAAKAGEECEEPREPRLDRYMVEGTTIEALQEVLRDDPDARQNAPAHKVLSRHDEMSEFFANLDRYKSGGSGGGDRGAYLRLYNGGRFSLDRIGRGSFAVSNWSACFLGGCQPGPIQRIAREAADDGLLQRFLFCVPSRQDVGVDQPPDQAAAARYTELFPILVAMHPAPAIGSDHIRPIVLHADGHAIREEVDAIARAIAGMPDTSKRLQSAFGKWPGLFARLCLTFHMINIADARRGGMMGQPIAVVPVATIERVSNFMLDIVLPHLKRAESMMFSTSQTGHAQWIGGHILAKGLTRITTRDVTRAYGALRAPEVAHEFTAVMGSLVAVGWLEPEESPNPAKPTHAWLVNPNVHTIFAARAEKERVARADAKDLAATDIRTLMKKRKDKESKA